MIVRLTPISFICILLVFLQMASCTTQRKIKVGQQATYLSGPEMLYPPVDVIIATHNAWTRAYYPTRIKVFKEQPLQLHDIVFLGNSITEQGEDWGKRLNKEHVKNRGIAGDVTDGVLARLGEVVYVKPPAVFIEIGINDLFNPTLTPERTANNIIRIADTIKKYSPRTRIFVQTIFPTKNDFLVSKISKTNELLRSYKKDRPYILLETHTLFADSADLMNKELTKDGVHLNEKGYAIWVNYLRKFF